MPEGMRRRSIPPGSAATMTRAACRTGLGVVAGLLVATSVLAAPLVWTQARLGSWAIVEAWHHALGTPKVARITTTLVGRDGGAPMFRHVDEAGRVWEDGDPGAGLGADAGFEPGGEDRFMTRQVLRIDGQGVPCRVILNEKRGGGWGREHAVQSWVTRSKRWEAIDTTLRVRVLKVLDLGMLVTYRDGRVERRPGLSMQTVKSLHEPVRVHGRTYDCWVHVTKTLHADSSFAGRITVWGSEAVPTGWVRRLRETRDARNGAMAREQEQLVDFQMR